MSEKDHKVSRRQFLTYTLTGVGGFMAAGMLMPMARFALDPALRAGAESEFLYVCDVDQLTEDPQVFPFSFDQVDAWYESEVSRDVYVYIRDNEVTALSAICTHLGCTVAYDGNDDFPEQFFCPCHFGRFDKDGHNIPGTPPRRPLDAYEVKVEDGKVYLGSIYQRT
ncbi:ubiquinol-cytochrome c reductase iron-sulfur subunit [Halalkalibacter sp. APA_J-10(15)]|uniref:ubiquinol-cytochrome c reductase iron-sulfur subunit n=1 Tax=unclassified Halalkalibacter TaxID=2893063 RepID=UPI001FF4C931|nr:ubiquinol-cytochrome c reductase iron-sulfur subunit [Halalkalibacter sp. APA_J-10(15)]MCK0472104.1 ubiquinol-cytochrome c reductase iron-sulfur subunit [Halalkalibacter sp. APA_J-10(15)]